MTIRRQRSKSVQGKRILLIVGGGIAAYKSLELVRRLKERGASVRAILTKGGAEFVTPLSISVLTEERAFTDLFDLKDEAEIGHIRLSREADLIVVAPATADLLAKMAHGLADDLATAVLLASDKPVLVAPAMNVRMWEHPATQRNLATLRADGIRFVGPEEGEMACGEFGLGRMAEPATILEAIVGLLGSEKVTPLTKATPLRTL
ncbi:MAG: flavoprotein, partial [Methyloceanibacter sp.]